jgi:hypothetical protein
MAPRAVRCTTAALATVAALAAGPATASAGGRNKPVQHGSGRASTPVHHRHAHTASLFCWRC